MLAVSRKQWTQLSDRALLEQCDIDTYRASGPGGQKRNKTSSAVRLRHSASGLIVIAEESRSQHENRARALRRLRKSMYLKLRTAWTSSELDPAAVTLLPDFQNARDAAGRLHLSHKDQRYWPAVGVVLDVLNAVEARVHDAAKFLGLSTGNLIDFLQSDVKVWEEANHLRIAYGQRPLRHS